MGPDVVRSIDPGKAFGAYHWPLPSSTSFVSFGEWICSFLSGWKWGGGVGEGNGRESRNKGSGWWIRVKEVRRVDGNRSCRACLGLEVAQRVSDGLDGVKGTQCPGSYDGGL